MESAGTGTVICNICIDDVPLDKVVTLKCNPVHTFCYKCIFDWYKQPNHKKYSTGQKKVSPRVCPICRKDGGPLPLPEGETEFSGIHNIGPFGKAATKAKAMPKSYGVCYFAGCDEKCYTPPVMALNPFTHNIFQIDACTNHIKTLCLPVSRKEIATEEGSAVMTLKNGEKVVPFTCFCDVEMEGGASHCTKVASLISPKWLSDPDAEHELIMDTVVNVIDAVSLYGAALPVTSPFSSCSLPYKKVKEPLCHDHTLLYKHGIELRLKGGAKVIPKGGYTGKKLNTHCLAPVKSKKGSTDVCLNRLNDLCECKVNKHNTDIFALPGEKTEEGAPKKTEPKIKIKIKKASITMTVSGNSVTVTSGTGSGTGTSSTSSSLILAAMTPVDATLCGTPLKNGNGVCCLKGKAEFGGKCGKHKLA